MALKAFCNIGCCCLLIVVHGVAGSAGETRAEEALAEAKHLELLAMDVGTGSRCSEVRIKKMGQGISGDKGKKGPLGFLVVTGMTRSAKVELLLSGEGADTGDEGCRFDGGVVLMKPYVVKRGAVTAFAVDTIDDRAGGQDLSCGQRPRRFKISVDIGGVAFKTAAGDRAVEACVSGGKPRAVGPGMKMGEPGKRQLVESAFFPIAIGLSFFGGAKGDVEFFGAGG